jgi:predicted small lipoprotein YifL
MSRSRCTEAGDPAATIGLVARRTFVLALLAAPLAACGIKGGLELPPPEPYEEEPDPIEDPDTYGDPSTFPEPGEDEELAE